MLALAGTMLLALLLGACATPGSGPEQLQRSWDAAHVRVLHGDAYVFGRLSAPINQQELARLPPGKRFPTVIYLHGCNGLDWENASRTLGQLMRSGFALIAPDSFAQSHRKNVCHRGLRGIFALRAAEASHAAEQARRLPWVDPNNLFLIGHSEGGAGAAAYRGDDFNAIVISAFGCNDGIAAPAPSLAVASNNDPQITGVTGICPGASERLILPGNRHHLMRDEAVAQRVTDFLLAHIRR